MGINLPRSGSVFLPEVPQELKEVSPELFTWAQSLKRGVVTALQDAFANSLHIATAISSRTSGTFTISSGGSIVVTSGIVVIVTS